MEDPDECAEARKDGEHVHEDRLDRQHNGTQQHREDEQCADDHHRGGAWELCGDGVHHIHNLRGTTTNERLNTIWWRDRTRFSCAERVWPSGAQLCNKRARLWSIRTVGWRDGDRGEIVLGGQREDLHGESIRRCTSGRRVEELILRKVQARVNRDERFHTRNSRIRLHLLHPVVEEGDVLRARGRSFGANGNAHWTERTFAKCVGQCVERLPTRYAFREDAPVRCVEADAEPRCAERYQERKGGERHGERPAHHGACEAGPWPLLVHPTAAELPDGEAIHA